MSQILGIFGSSSNWEVSVRRICFRLIGERSRKLCGANRSSGGHVTAHPAGVVAGAVDEIRPTRRTVVGYTRVTSGDVYRAAALHARIRDDGRAVRTDVELINCEFA